MTTILHLSDPHFGGHHHFRQTSHDPGRSTLGQVISDCGIDPDWIIISGDLFSQGEPSDYLLVVDAIKDLVKTMGVASDRLLLVPGNHDLTWKPDYSDRPFAIYDDIVERLGLPNFATDKLPQVVVLPHSPVPIAVLLLNSCRVEGPAMAGIGRIGDDQLRSLRQRLAEAKVTPATHIMIAVLHHHLLPISSAQIINPPDPKGSPVGKSSITVDAVEVLRELSKLGVTMILHGHQHHPAVIRYENLYADTGEINVIAAGSAGVAREGEPVRRQFFTYDIERQRCHARSYEQSPHNESRFDPHGDWHLDLRPERLRDVCDAERLVRFELKQEALIERALGDNSDLNYLLMSVVECPRSREVIRKFIHDLPSTDAWTDLGARYLNLVGMYDLLGRWDLLVRFRYDPRVAAHRVVQLIDDALTAARMLPEPDKRPTSLFGQMDLLDVRGEARSLAGLIPENRGIVVNIQRVRMRSTADYDQARSQRGFLYVELPGRGLANSMIKDLEGALQKDSESQKIIESVARAEKEIIFDLFMSCAQSSHVNRMNRTIEGVLTRYGVQKYTLLCYGYDEEEILVGQEVAPTPTVRTGG